MGEISMYSALEYAQDRAAFEKKLNNYI